ncbi:MAG: PQQ-binding-like beta-propeller repeat protein [Planctomycetota bacterium]
MLSSWPDGGPKLKWSATDLGAGFSSISQSGDRLVTLGTEGQNCLAICLNAKDGSTIWKRVIGETATDKGYNTGWGGGPRSSPTISGDRVYVLSDLGQLAALRLSSGDPIWTVDLVGELGGKIPTWGYSASPLIDGDRVVIGVGGKSFLIALNKDTGNTLLRSSGSDEDDGSIDGAEYVSVMKHTVHGKSLYICASRSGLMGFDVESMKRTFHAPATGNRVAVIPTPICVDDLIYHTSAYGAGCQLVRVLPDGKTRIEYAKNNQTMENHHGGTVLVDNVIYGFSKQMGGGWMAHDFESGQNLWNERIRGVRSGSIAYADGLLYCYNANAGKLLLVRPNREELGT